MQDMLSMSRLDVQEGQAREERVLKRQLQERKRMKGRNVLQRGEQ